MLTGIMTFVFVKVPLWTGYMYLGNKVVKPVFEGIANGIHDGIVAGKKDLKEMEMKKLSEEHVKG